MSFFLTTKLGRSIGLVLIGLIFSGLIYVSFQLWLSHHDKAVLKGYVTEVRATAAEAELERYKHDLNAMKIVADAYQEQYKNALEKLDVQDAQAEEDRKAYADKNPPSAKGRYPDDSDIDFLLRKRSR